MVSYFYIAWCMVRYRLEVLRGWWYGKFDTVCICCRWSYSTEQRKVIKQQCRDALASKGNIKFHFIRGDFIDCYSPLSDLVLHFPPPECEEIEELMYNSLDDMSLACPCAVMGATPQLRKAMEEVKYDVKFYERDEIERAYDEAMQK